jgi:predicted DNA-binding protein
MQERKKGRNNMSTLSFRVPEELKNKLGLVANETDRSVSYHILLAIERYLDEYSDFQIAWDRLNNINDPIVSMDEMRKSLGL